MVGYIHSTESFGTVDGPGIRFTIFMQGCPLRCLYCHNPDTWKTDIGKPITAEKLIDKFKKNRPFYRKGGITVTGGEPLLQIDFVIELFKLAKRNDIHTCIDTSGITFNRNEQTLKKFDELMKYTDLVMLDIKHINPEKHKILTGADNKNILDFAEYLNDKNIPLWVRCVIVKGYTDDENDLAKLGHFVGKLKNLKVLDVLPYHTLGVSKYKELGIEYPLKDLDPLPQKDAIKAKQIILNEIKQARRQSYNS